MQSLQEAPGSGFAGIDIVLTDVDDTLTRSGRLEGGTLDALDRLQRNGIRVVPATAASAGWASLMVHMWPIEGVIAENGGLYFFRNAQGKIERRYLNGTQESTEERAPRQRMDQALDLDILQQRLLYRHSFLELADDQPYRESCLAFHRPPSADLTAEVLASVADVGGGGTVNSLWLLAWADPRDKLTMARRMLAEVFGVDIDDKAARERILYVGDSENDEPMFEFFTHTVGVSTVIKHPLTHWPNWITRGPGGAGFVEVVDHLIDSRTRPIR